MDVTITGYGDHDVKLSNGAEFRLRERDGHLEVRVTDGSLVILPRAANSVEIAAVDWHGQEVGQ